MPLHIFEKIAENTKNVREKLPAPPSKAVVATKEKVTIIQAKIRFTLGPFNLEEIYDFQIL